MGWNILTFGYFSVEDGRGEVKEPGLDVREAQIGAGRLYAWQED